MLSPQEKSVFMARHYWSKFDFADTVSLWGEKRSAEQIFVDYLAILGQVEPAEAGRSEQKMLAEAEAADSVTFMRFIDLYEKYLYDPNSPMRNEELYIPVLEYIIASPALPELEKLRPRRRLEMALKNRPGMQAIDFAYTVASDVTRRMYDIRTEYTILFFNNPGCTTCKSMREEISASPLLSEMIRTGRLKILAFYPDEDLTEWQNYRHNIPPEWINAYDGHHALRSGDLYDLKAIPTLYLLSHNKTVLIKDALSIQQIVHYLQRT